jgi:hypothetical protein
MTRLSGKTTTLEALVHRSGLKAITFRTKRGELGFEDARRLPLFFDQAGLTHWRALEGLIEATLEERVRREPGVRAAIIKLCEDASSLEEVYARVQDQAQDPRTKGFLRDVFTKLQAYLDLVLPQIRALEFTSRLELRPGANVMDLEGLSDEMQNLILQGVIHHIYEHETNTIIVMPEAWKFLPQDRGSPCKPIVERFIREGAAIGNYLWIDSQDLRGVDKKYLRQIDNWVLGRQRDPHEVESTLDVLPLPRHLKPRPEEIQTLEVGHFYACLHNEVFKVYVQPKWLSEEEARQVALGKLSVTSLLRAQPSPPPRPQLDEENRRLREQLEAQAKELERLKAALEAERVNNANTQALVDKLRKELKLYGEKLTDYANKLAAYKKLEEALTALAKPDPNEVRHLVRQELAALAPSRGLTVGRREVELVVNVSKETVEAEESSLRGQLALLIAEGELDKPQTPTTIARKLRNLGYTVKMSDLQEELLWFTKQRILNHITYANGSHRYQVRDRTRIKLMEVRG